jgi:glycosyltransferase involved in cell wall biosynthesis
MLRNRLYYELKPYLPYRFRMALRRPWAARKRESCQDVWPINGTAARPPDGWPGWPDGKKFAFVLTHDVEGPEGLAKCRDLMKIEMDLGFRSSFNFVPEGDYIVPSELRAELTHNGFEVGVQDLHHDGKLYRSRRDFAESAVWINRYLKEWGAVGFRSGFMFHNLDWHHDLDILYGSSTFDTDPFEPQPDGVNTIFPFWVPSPKFETRNSKSENRNTSSLIPHPPSPIPHHSAARPGYVEIPYTLPQDSTVFLLLREKTTDIWTRKLDWIAEHGGMALVIVHPDYLRFDGEKPSPRTFPVELYRQFLEYARRQYANKFWNSLPREVSVWYRGYVSKNLVAEELSAATSCATLPRPLAGRLAAVLVYSGHPNDARPRREAEALLAEGMSVDYICLEDDHAAAGEEVRGRLRVTRLPIKHKRKGKAAYLIRYPSFILRSLLLLAARSCSRRYDIVHVHNMPDVLVFGALMPRMCGARVILDLHDPMPELYQTIFHVPPNSVTVKLLKLLEKWSIGFADLVLTPNNAFREAFCSRGCPRSKIQIVMNTPDEAIFSPNGSEARIPSTTEQRTKFRVMYHGLIAERQGLLTALQAMKVLARNAPEVTLDIYGSRTAYLDVVEHMIKDMRLEDTVRYKGKRRLEEIPDEILQADLGIVPNLRTPFTEINFPTRIFEYLAMGCPVIAPRTRGIRDYFGEDEILYFEPDNPDDLARVILQARDCPERTGDILDRGIEVYRRHLWNDECRRFVGLVKNLLENAQSGR